MQNRFWSNRQGRGLAGGLLLALALNIMLWGNFAPLASAHAHLVSATVAPQAMLNKAPASITLTFGEESDLKETRIQVLDGKRADISSGPAMVAAGDAKTWTTSLKSGLADGTYTVKYHTLTDDDGGIVDGSYSFTIATTGTAAAGTASGTVEKEAGGDNVPGAAPAMGGGGAALNAADSGGSLGLLSGLVGLILAAGSLLVLRRQASSK